METPNKFLVGAGGRGVVIQNPPRGPMTQDDTALLIAWLLVAGGIHLKNVMQAVCAITETMFEDARPPIAPTYRQSVETIVYDPRTHGWLYQACLDLDLADPVDAIRAVEILLRVCQQRLDEIQGEKGSDAHV